MPIFLSLYKIKHLLSIGKSKLAGDAAMAARALRKEGISCGLMNIIPIQVFMVRLIVDRLDEREVSRKKGGSG
ncbi:MAG TPA: hypothetical protein VGK47_03580 [Nitrososphaeraceae archaeon]